ncbi:hypothetical protein NL108_006362 [Boleophthalmus pectinirostris]|nr:hypothetical protein NL108_006362 [Boleophthalmus pectinirostris]
MEMNETTNAFVRTTTAITMFNGGVKDNVIPSYAEAFVNLRIHSAQSLKEVLEFVETTIGDPRVKMDIVKGFDLLPVNPYNETSLGYQLKNSSGPVSICDCCSSSFGGTLKPRPAKRHSPSSSSTHMARTSPQRGPTSWPPAFYLHPFISTLSWTS